jgi:ribosomal protein S18 acetylase RimI-like enzyme
VKEQEFDLVFEAPSVADFLQLRSAVGWPKINAKLVKKSLINSLFHILVYHNQQLVGMGRVIGDGALYFYIQDVVVAPTHQRLGIGAALMEHIEAYIDKNAEQGATIGLMAAQGKEDFYRRYGYLQRPTAILGHGMCKFL